MPKVLLLEYKKLSEEYDKIFDLSNLLMHTQRLLSWLKEKSKIKRDDKKIAYFLEEKSKIAQKIKLLSEKISNINPFFEDKKNLHLLKKELEKIENKAYKLLELEKKSNFLYKAKPNIVICFFIILSQKSTTKILQD